ncbi:MAG: hypothetical protein U9N46_12930 [Euryarchaeota archaeon]|nr:hypothetical protein [Euryarchaeota archaeon]
MSVESWGSGGITSSHTPHANPPARQQPASNSRIVHATRLPARDQGARVRGRMKPGRSLTTGVLINVSGTTNLITVRVVE